MSEGPPKPEETVPAASIGEPFIPTVPGQTGDASNDAQALRPGEEKWQDYQDNDETHDLANAMNEAGNDDRQQVAHNLYEHQPGGTPTLSNRDEEKLMLRQLRIKAEDLHKRGGPAPVSLRMNYYKTRTELGSAEIKQQKKLIKIFRDYYSMNMHKQTTRSRRLDMIGAKERTGRAFMPLELRN